MKVITRLVYVLLCFGLSSVLGYPRFRQANNDLDLQTLCNTEAVQTILDLDLIKPTADTPSDLVNRQLEVVLQNSYGVNEIQALFKALEGAGMDETDSSFEGVLGNRYARDTDIEMLLQNQLVNKLRENLPKLQLDCRKVFDSERRGLVNDLDDTDHGIFDKETIIRPVETRSRKLAEVENLNNQLAEKRAKLSLNPTGWRKRRSQTSEDARVQEFLHNMRQLLEKRQRRLEFNPTGW